MRQSPLVLLFLALVLSGCDKGNEEPESSVDVYTAGVYNGRTVYWKNGEQTILANPPGADGGANKIALSGTDIYVAGRTGSAAMLWKNGTGTNITDGSSSADARYLVILNNDIYIPGFEYAANSNYVVYWKNGVKNILSPTNGIPSGNAICVSDGIVYVVGEINNKAILWKNGVATPLSNSTSYANDVFVSGTDVYIAGSENNKAVYWKNGVKVALSNEVSLAKAIGLLGNDVYVVGHIDYSKAVYWKNGVQSVLATSPVGFATANDITFDGTDVYIAGAVDDLSLHCAVYWKNGTRVEIASIGLAWFGPCIANSIVVVKR